MLQVIKKIPVVVCYLPGTLLYYHKHTGAGSLE